MTHHEHTSSDGFLAAHMMLVMLLLAVIAAVVIIALVAWQPWDDDGEGGVDIDISGGEGEGGGDTGGGDTGGDGDTSWHYDGPTFVIERAA